MSSESAPAVKPPLKVDRELVVRIILGALAVLLLIGVLEFDNPWKIGIEKVTVAESGGKLEDFINAGQWTACLVNALLCAGLAVTAPWWLGKFALRDGAEPDTRPWWKRVLGAKTLWIAGVLFFGAFIMPMLLPVGGAEPFDRSRGGFFNPFPHDVVLWIQEPASNFWGLAVSLFLVLAATVSWLVLPFGTLSAHGDEDVALQRTLAPPPAWQPLFYILLLIIVGFAGWIRAPRLDHSLWNDEEYSLRRYVWGEQKVQADGSLKPDRVKWSETLFFNRGANNHIPHSITSRLSLEVWSRVFQGQSGERFFSEHAYRLPAYLAGLLGIIVLALLLADVGLPAVGLTAAALMAMHPWHLRYSVEARGYAWMLLFILLALFFLNRALRKPGPDEAGESRGGNQWRWWLGYGLCQFLYMWSFPGAIYVAASLNTAAFGWIAWNHRAQLLRPLETPLPRLIIANVGSVMLFLQAMAPSIPQIRLYLQREISQGDMNLNWWRDIGAHVVSGVQWFQPIRSDFDDVQVELHQLYQTQPVLAPLVLVVLLLALATGIAMMLWRNRQAGVVFCAFLLAAPLAWLHTRISGNFLYSWYLLYSVIPLTILIAAAPRILAARSNGYALWRICGMGALALLISGGFAWLNAGYLVEVRYRPRQSLSFVSNRQALSFQDLTDQFSGDDEGDRLWETSKAIAVFGVSAEQFRSYEPRISVLKNAGDLREFICKSVADGEAPIVFVSGPDRAAKEDTDTMEALMHMRSRQPEKAYYATEGIEAMFRIDAYVFAAEPQLCEIVSSAPPQD